MPFLKYEPLWSSEPGFYGPYSLLSHISFVGPHGMSTHSQSSGASARVGVPITAVSSDNIYVDPTVTSTSAVTHIGAETTAATTPAHGFGIEAVTITYQGVIPGADSSITAIPHAAIMPSMLQSPLLSLMLLLNALKLQPSPSSTMLS